MELIHPIFKWLHVIAGVMWIGLLYFFNFINGSFAGTMDKETKQKVMPELLPRTLFWFRWGAAWTWVTGLILLYVIYWAGSLSMGMTGDEGSMMADSEGTINMWTHIMISFTFLAVFLYDFLYKSPLAKNLRLITIITFFLIAGVEYLMIHCGQFGFRAVNIHIGAMFGTIMAFNVWFRIWPAQQKIITAIKNGDTPDGTLVALAGQRSKHNTYLSVPLIWTMINEHTAVLSGKIFDINGLVLLVIIAIGWHIVFQFYKIGSKVKGF
ncbi:MAG: urate hydroxylase PuuD [Candidatus Marinimicrobia bacterium]|nr:urate hydroxylase PuuD [Candidatus Neomarinimicrobiota bacterium]